MRRVITFFVILFFVTMTVAASARPMEVAVFEANAYAEPSDDAPIVQVFIEGTQLSAGEEAENGWLRVRLESGGLAWMHASDLKPHREAPSVLRRPEPERVRPTPAPAPSRSTYTQVYVKDLDHLARLVRHDEVVYPMAKSLAEDHTLAQVGRWGGLIGGGALVLVGATQYDSSLYNADNDTAYALVGLGCGVMLVGLLVWLVAEPSKGDLLDVVNTWNGRHPDEPFTMENR